MRPLYIFDLDGTLALIEHRKHMLDDPLEDWSWRIWQAAKRDERRKRK